jgi:zinc/manganese transport system substrate-binding protein
MQTAKGGNKFIMPAAVVIILILIAVAAGIYLSKGSSGTTTVTHTVTSGDSSSSVATGSNTVIQITAAENFWGSLVSQLAGVHGNVTSVVTDPNTDPHDYQSSTADARLIADSKLVIINGMNYDNWAGLLINASNTPGQTVINVQHLVGITNDQLETINPHLWYSPYYVNDSVHAFYNALVSLDPTDTAYFHANYATLNSSLYTSYMHREAEIKAQYSGTTVAATESIFLFMANATGLDVISPQAFMKAVAEGNDPAPADIVTFQQLLMMGNTTVHVLAYNEQTVTPVTQQLKALAAQYEIPTFGVTETVQPPDATFQFWMGGEVIDLQNALNAVALGQ